MAKVRGSFKPMLAEATGEMLAFPALFSVKIDGIRGCVMGDGIPYSRKIKPIPNNYIRNMIESWNIPYHDGELMTYDKQGKMKAFNPVQSDVMTEAGSPDFRFFVFDHFEHPDAPYDTRRKFIRKVHERLMIVNQILIHDQATLDRTEQQAVDDGWEGLIGRSQDGIYKYGRSTVNEQLMWKVVRKERTEVTITGMVERQENLNEQTINELGYAKRSSHKDNKIGRGDMGALLVREDDGTEGSVGTGFDDDLRAWFWSQRENVGSLKKATIEFRGRGTNGKMRFPAFVGLRHEDDMS